MRATRLLAVSMVVTLVACGGGPGASPTDQSTTSSAAPTTTESNEGGFGAPSQVSGEFDLGLVKPVVGTLLLAEHGCWYAKVNGFERLVVLPEGFELNPEAGGELIDQTGTVYRDGDRFDAVGSTLPRGLIPGGEDGKWGNYIAFCQPRLNELIVFDSLVDEFDPTSLTGEEVTDLVRQARFTEHWDCGRGWATSTSDQTVGLVIYESSTERTDTSDQIVFPDPDWQTSVRFGKNLFAEHCNDAIEDWVVLPDITIQWPLIEGIVTVTDPIPGLEDAPALVRAVFDGGQIETESGLVSLPRIELNNRSFNFFAG